MFLKLCLCRSAASPQNQFCAIWTLRRLAVLPACVYFAVPVPLAVEAAWSLKEHLPAVNAARSYSGAAMLLKPCSRSEGEKLCEDTAVLLKESHCHVCESLFDHLAAVWWAYQSPSLLLRFGASVFPPSFLHRCWGCLTAPPVTSSSCLVLTCCVSRDVKTWHLTSRVSCLRKKSIYLSSCLSHHNRHSCHDSLFIIGLWYATVTSPRLVSTPPARCWLRPLRPPCFFYTF